MSDLPLRGPTVNTCKGYQGNQQDSNTHQKLLTSMCVQKSHASCIYYTQALKIIYSIQFSSEIQMSGQLDLLQIVFQFILVFFNYFYYYGPARAGPLYEIRIGEAYAFLRDECIIWVYIYFLNGQLLMHMILYFLCKEIRWVFQ